MTQSNHTVLTFFIIKGISDDPEMQTPIFLLVLLIYLISLSGNLTIFILVCLDHHLQTPMYFFLCNLSILDISATTITLHNVLHIFPSGSKIKITSFLGCMSQMYLVLSLAGNVLFMLTAMSYDRYVAICNALRYSMVMNHKVCALLATFCWIFGFITALPHILVISSFSCYRSNEINHFFCDMVPLMQLTCSDTSAFELYILIEGILVGLMPFLLTFISYVFIIQTILRIHSSTGRRKTFYTCSSHLVVVILLYLSLFFQYLRPSSTDNVTSIKIVSLFNTAIIPMLNPLIYSLKNKDVKSALRRRLKSCTDII
ncbi:olfactory receptor 6C74-like [Discoglossus pictus]